MQNSRRFWITGATNGLGLALVAGLLEQGHQVAASGRDSPQLAQLAHQHGERLLRLAWRLNEQNQAAVAAEQLQAAWAGLDGLIINAGTCDYLADDVPATDVFQAIVTSNLQASAHCLAAALPLLAEGNMPQVLAILSRHSAMQLHEPNQPLSGANSPPHWFREQRPVLQALGIDLTLVAPQSLKAPVTLAQAIPEPWTPQSAAHELLSSLAQREPELVLEALSLNSLWPLPR
ncbi:SDR family NAD(P)-dependent oxidoreductase [Pseudomonas sp. BP8]|uniref:SDR family NAD(P)-dependent oxidoreductase n=1 Tax=Pseudomonas sp. BP8 TaxID=2817864 RepID=UPI001AE0EB37|nr:SDR family NAD(P)-dependent oxidoreductase [Pseudomonas sp. BP8]HDS1736665.1 SDR family NAD(P)-dependent oxidoreductase [Pseudomonas putida]